MAEETPIQVEDYDQDPDTFAFTVDEDDVVLEFIRSDADGIFVRENGDWSQVDLEQDQPTIDDQEWVDVMATEAAIEFWDANGDGDVTREQITDYIAPMN